MSGRLAVFAGAAGLLIAAVAANRLVARRTERKHPPQGKFIQVDGVRLHYLEKGAGEPIVLIHGNGVTAEDWVVSGVFDRLAKTHRVIAFDRPGFGYSDRPRTTIWTATAQAALIHTACKMLNIDRGVVVGHSWGTLVALALALEHPGDVSKLVLMSGYYMPTARLDVPMMSGPAIPGLGDLIRYTVSPLMGRIMAPLLFKQMFSPMKVTERFKAEFPTAMVLRPSQIRASAADTALMIPEAAKTKSRHGELKMPVLIMAGTGDKIVSFKHQSQRLSRDIGHSRLHDVVGAGHMIHHIAPEEVANAILSSGAPTMAETLSRPHSATVAPLAAAE